MAVASAQVWVEPDYSKNPTFFRSPMPQYCTWFKYFIGSVQFTRCRFAQILVMYRRNGIELPVGTFRVEAVDLSAYGAGYGTGDACWKHYHKERKRRRVERVALRHFHKTGRFQA